MTSSPRVRFAPAPTGYLHIGGARTALFNWLFARQSGGELLLRIEDTDAERSRPELVEAIYESLRWLGIDWDGEVVHQSDRLERHKAAVAELIASGAAYWCDCQPEEVQARARSRGGKPGYDGHCRDRGLEPSRTPGMVVRFRSPDEGSTEFDDVVRGHISFENSDIEDFVVLRSTGMPMFLVANAVDDADMGITHVIRGEDLINVTPKVLLLRKALGITYEPVFAHLPLIVNEKRQKLSKRRDDVAVGDYVERGYLPEAMANYLATLGWGPPDGVEVRPIEEIVELFRLEDVNKASAFFDLRKLDHFNGEHIRRLDAGEFVQRCRPWLESTPLWPADRFDEAVFERIAPLVQERVSRLDEVAGYIDFLFAAEVVVDPSSWEKAIGRDPRSALGFLEPARALLATCDWTAEAIAETLNARADELGVKRKVLQAPLRVAVTGRAVGPPLWESLELLGRSEVLARIDTACARAAAESQPGPG